MYKSKTVYEPSRYDFYERKDMRVKDENKGGLVLKIEWPKEKIFDDGKQSNTLTGAAHPGCCKK